MGGERRLGELLINIDKNKRRVEKTGQGSRGSKNEPRGNIPTLSDIRINKKESSRAQKASKIPEV